MVRRGPVKSEIAGSNPAPAAMDYTPEDVERALASDDGCILAAEVRRLRAENAALVKMTVYAQQLEAQIEDLKIDVQMHDREHCRVESARLLPNEWRTLACRCTNDPASPTWLISCAEDLEEALE